MVYNELEQGDILCCWSTLRLGTPSVRGYPLVFNFDHSQNSPDSRTFCTPYSWHQTGSSLLCQLPSTNLSAAISSSTATPNAKGSTYDRALRAGPVMRRPSGCLVCLSGTHRLPDAFRGERQRRQAHTDRLRNGIGNGWRRGHQATLPNAL
jgi:hypothetical protein